jgi:hypothetical protein
MDLLRAQGSWFHAARFAYLLDGHVPKDKPGLG